jgi:hypothetical protein
MAQGGRVWSPDRTGIAGIEGFRRWNSQVRADDQFPRLFHGLLLAISSIDEHNGAAYGAYTVLAR